MYYNSLQAMLKQPVPLSMLSFFVLLNFLTANLWVFAVTLNKQNIFSYILKKFSWHGRKNILFHQQLWWVCSPSNIRFNPQSHTWMADENKEMLLGFTISNAIKNTLYKRTPNPTQPKVKFQDLKSPMKIVTRKRKSYQTSVFCSIFGCNN